MEFQLKSIRLNLTGCKEVWRDAFSHWGFRIQLSITMLVVFSFSFIFHYFFPFVESRNGSLLSDIVLLFIPPADVSGIVFFFLYSGIFIGLLSHYRHPKVILLIFQTYALVTLTRMATITLLPLEPPIGYIPLREPFVQLFTPGGAIISKDLFFSGHMSTILSLYFASHRFYTRAFLLFSAMMMGALLLIQHVHYSIDVLVAVPVTYIIYFFCKKYLGGKSF